jgi:hypothetical protein
MRAHSRGHLFCCLDNEIEKKRGTESPHGSSRIAIRVLSGVDIQYRVDHAKGKIACYDGIESACA